MRFVLYIILLGAGFGVACRSSDNAPANANRSANQGPAAANTSARAAAALVHSKIDACALLSSDDLKAVQGEAYKDAQRSDRQDGEFIVAQCYYAMPTTANSVVLNVTTAKDEPGARTPKAFWEQTFGGDEEKERKGERDKEKAKDAPRERGEEGEAKEASAPKKVNGLGDEAFWIGSPIGGALYVLKNDLSFRISVGGAGDQNSKLNKSKTLAQKVLKRL